MNQIIIDRVKEFILELQFSVIESLAIIRNLVRSTKPMSRFAPRLMVLMFCMLAGRTAFSQNVNVTNTIGPMDIEVNNLTGNTFLERTDFIIPATESILNISFSYNSFDFDIDKGFGNGWSFFYDIQYRLDTGNNVIIIWGDGSEDVYKKLGNGNYRAPIGFFDELKEYEPGKFSVTQTNGLKYWFENSTNRKVTKISTPNDNYVNLTYNGVQLASLSNNFNHTVTFTYNSQNKLASVTDAIASPVRTWTYNYDKEGNLTSVTDPLSNTDAYTYLINGPMQTVRDKNLNVVDLVYYPNYTLKEMVGCNKRLSFAYDEEQLLTVVTNYIEGGENQINKYYFSENESGETWLRAISNNCCGPDEEYEYDERGNMVKETDALGNSTEYTYDELGNVLTVTDALAQKTTFTYTSDFNRISTVKTPNGDVFRISYDAKGNMVQITEPGERKYTATYDENGNIISSTNPKGHTFHYQYEDNGNLKMINGPEGFNLAANFSPRGDLNEVSDSKNQSNSFEYDILGRLTKITDPLSNSQSFAYDAMGNLTREQNQNDEVSYNFYDASNRLKQWKGPHGVTLSVGYDAMDNITGIADGEGGVTSFRYDSQNQLSQITDPEGNIESFNYDKNGNLITEKLPHGQVITYTYDALNRIKEVKDESGTLDAFDYDANGNVVSYTGADGSITTFEYDELNRLKKVKDALGETIGMSYDEAGNMKTFTDEAGNVSSFSYDDRDRLIKLTESNGAVTLIGYDASDNIISLTDGNNHTTTYTYDALDRVIKSTFPDGRYEEYTYDVKSNMIAFKNKAGQLIEFGYDSLDRVIEKLLPDGKIFQYTYDNNDNITSAAGPAGTAYFTYDIMGRITSEQFEGRTVSYSYDVAGRTQEIIYPGGTKVSKIFDARGRLISIAKDNEEIVSYQYNNADQVIGRSYANGLNTALQYDFAGRLSSMITGDLQSLSFTYDKNENITSIIREGTNQSEFFSYDSNNRLVTYKRGAAGGPYEVEDTYTYDALGNRASANIGGKNITYSVNNLNQLTSLNDGSTTTTFQYDDNGNLIFDGRYHKFYDAEKRLLKDSASPAAVITYEFDAIGRRISRSVNGHISRYTYSVLEAIEERDENEYLKSQTIFNRFLEPVLNEIEGVPYYYHSNHLNSIDLLTDVDGALKEQYLYDGYGKQTVYDASGNELQGSSIGNRFGFTGQVYDSATGHNQFFFRTYNPETGLFGQQDLIGYGDGMAMYQYVGNNPANGIDVFGLECEPKKKGGNLMSVYHMVRKPIGLAARLGNAVNVFANKRISKLKQDYGSGKGLRRTKNMTPQQHRDVTNARKGWRDAKADIKSTKKSSGRVGKVAGLGKLNLKLAGLDVGLSAKGAYDTYTDPGSTSIDSWKANSNLVSSGALGAAGIAAYTAGAAPYWVAGTTLGIATLSVVDFGLTYFTGKDTEEHLYDKVTKHAVNRYGSYREQKELQSHYKYLQENFGQERADLYLELYRRGSKRKGCTSKGSGKNPPPYRGPKTQTTLVSSLDPNEMIGPEGQPDLRWVSVKDRLPYTVLFENHEDASAPAKYVRIQVPVHDKMDAATLHLSSIGFNNLSFSLPQEVSSNYQRLDARDSLGLFIDMTAGYDMVNNQFFWEFQSVDPVTMLPPDDPMKGFLLLQDTTVEDSKDGHGFVNFSVKPVADAKTLDSILARADIVFDINDTIPTNIEKNVIDAVAPSSQMTALNETYENEIPLSWSGTDDLNGSGVHYYTLYYSTDGTNFSVFKDQMTRTDTLFKGPGDQHYFFFVLATDSVGNVEELRPGAIQNSYLSAAGVVPVTWLYFKGTNKGVDNLLEWATASELNTKEYRVERSFDAREFTAIGNVRAAGNSAGNSSYQYTDYNVDRLGESLMYYRLAQEDLDGRLEYSNVIRLNYTTSESAKTIVYPNPTKGMITVATTDKALIGTLAQVYDEAGKLLQSVKITSPAQQFNLSGYTNGIYFIRLANKEVLRVMKR